MSLATEKTSYALQLFNDTLLPGDVVQKFCSAFTGFFSHATLDGTAITPGTENLPHAVGALMSGVSFAFSQTDKNLTCLFLQSAFTQYWAAEDPISGDPALLTMWPSCTPPAAIIKILAESMVPALDKEGMEPLEAQNAVAGAILEWLTAGVKVDVGGTQYFFQ
jgi:hypothetical protein